ncbi:VENN motif pre-toxin domain-containing protein [Erwinia sp. P6884]|uniref:VENN motif pre-toxin domain-containing protein n=1 Tax=Erwinia sp. P6884 TaxID=3141450 RepID=UPI0031993776
MVVQAIGGVLQGLVNGSISQAVAGGVNPLMAQTIKAYTTNPDNTSNKEANLMTHAVWGAVAAQMSGGNAGAGAAGAFSGELAGRFIAEHLYGADSAEKVAGLSEEERHELSLMSTLAAGLAGGLAGNSTAAITTGAQAGKNAVENNALSLPGGLMSYGQAAASWNQYAEANGLTPEQKQAGLDKLAKGDMPEGANITKVIVEGYKDGVLIAGAGYLGPAASVSKVIGGSVIGAVTNGSYQWFDMSQPGNEGKSYDYLGTGSAAIMGGLAPGRGVWQNVGIAAGGAVFTDGPNAGAIGASAAGAWAGGMFGEYAPGIVNSVTGKELPGFIYDIGGAFASEASTDAGKSIIKKQESGK